ncbi:hypothetical protein ACFLTE_04205 [Bacteroidota bacterium]
MKIMLKVLSILLFALLIIACEESENKDEQVAPELPPVSSFVIDFSDFTNNTKSVAIDDTNRQNNFGTAAFQAGIWNVIITVGMAVPVLSFLESFNHEPELVEIGWWKWSYDFKVNKINHTAVLHGKVTDSVTWEMYISKDDEFNDFKWYWGRGDILATGGYWILQEKPENRVDLLRIDWDRNPVDSIGNIRYMNIMKDHQEFGGYIHYGTTLDEPYNAFYHIYNKSADNLTEIEWNTEIKDGRIKNQNAFWDDEWHCWDNEQYNVECEE